MTYTVTVTGYVRHNGVRYAPGETITGLTEQEAERLGRAGVALVATPEGEPEGKPDKADKPKRAKGGGTGTEGEGAGAGE